MGSVDGDLLSLAELAPALQARLDEMRRSHEERWDSALRGRCSRCGAEHILEFGRGGLCEPCVIEVDYERRCVVALGVPERFRGLGIEHAGLRAWTERVRRSEERDGILIVGPAGTHKSGNAFAALASLCTARHCGWAKLPMLVRGLNLDEQRDRVGYLSRVPVALLDDLGAGVASEWADQTLCMILDERYDQQLPTIITSNLTPDGLAESFGDRVASRLSSYEVVVFGGPDSRRRSA